MQQQGHVGRGAAEFHQGWKALKVRLAPKRFSLPSIFQQWGKGLSEAQQKEARYLFLEFGYNVFLSNRLPYNRSIPDTRHSRCTGPGWLGRTSVQFGNELWEPCK